MRTSFGFRRDHIVASTFMGATVMPASRSEPCVALAPELFFLRPAPTFDVSGKRVGAGTPIEFLHDTGLFSGGDRLWRVRIVASGETGYATFSSALTPRCADGLAVPYSPSGVVVPNTSFGQGSYRVDSRFVVGELLTRDSTLLNAATSPVGSGSSVAFGGFATQLGMQLRGLVGSRASVIGTPTIAVVLPDPAANQRQIAIGAAISVADGQTITTDDINRVISRAVANSISLGLRPSATMPADGRPLFDRLMDNGGPRSPVYVSGSTTVTAIASNSQNQPSGLSSTTTGVLVVAGVGAGLALLWRKQISRWLSEDSPRGRKE